MDAISKSYDAKVDAKHRITLRSAKYEYYNVKEYPDGTILLQPRELTVPAGVSMPVDLAARRTLSGILRGQVRMAEDFNETPDEFREYL